MTRYLVLILAILISGAIIVPDKVQAETRYIGDTLIVTLRDGPDNTFRTLKTVRTGTPLTVLDKQGAYLKVKTDDGIIGWVARQYTVSEPPSMLLVPKLKDKINQLTASNKQLNNNIKELKEKLAQRDTKFHTAHQEILDNLAASQEEAKKLKQELEKTTGQYNDLLAQSKNVIQVRRERDQFKKSNSLLKNKVATLEQENNAMANSQVIYWFLAGGGVFLVGWMIGKTSLKRKKTSLSL